MSIDRLNKYNQIVDSLKKAKNNRQEIVSFAENMYKEAGVSGDTIRAAIDYAGGQSDVWRASFNDAFNKEYFGRSTKFEMLKKLNKEEQEAISKAVKFSVTVGGESGTTDYGSLVQTNIVAAIDGIFQQNSIFSRVQKIQDQESYQMPEFGASIQADRVAENAEGTGKNDIQRDGDTLTVTNQSNKIKVFDKVSDLFMRSIRPTDYGIMIARLNRAMEREFEREIFLGSNATGEFAGYINSTTGAAAFGALETELPLSGVAGGVQDDVDAVKYLIGDLPSEVSIERDKAKYALVMNNKTLTRLERQRDANGRTYDLSTEFKNIEIFSSFTMPDNRIGLFDLTTYSVLLAKPLDIEVEKEPNTEMLFVKSFTYADGGMRRGYKTLADGTTPNTEQNAHRYTDLKDDYSA